MYLNKYSIKIKDLILKQIKIRINLRNILKIKTLNKFNKVFYN